MADYDGDSSNYPTSITLPDDGNPRAALSVNTALEGLADRTARLNLIKGGVGTNNTWTGVNGFLGSLGILGALNFGLTELDDDDYSIVLSDGILYALPDTSSPGRILTLPAAGVGNIAIFFGGYGFAPGSDGFKLKRAGAGADFIARFTSSVTPSGFEGCSYVAVVRRSAGWRVLLAYGEVEIGTHG